MVRVTPKPTVWVVDGSGMPKPVQIETGLSDGTYTELLSDNMKEGDKVITERNWRAGRGMADPSRTLR